MRGDVGPLLGQATTKELLEELLIRGQEAPEEFISYRATLLGFAHGMLEWGKAGGKELLGRKRNDGPHQGGSPAMGSEPR